MDAGDVADLGVGLAVVGAGVWILSKTMNLTKKATKPIKGFSGWF